MMVDWVSAKIPVAHDKPLFGGEIITVDQNGEIQFRSRKLLQVDGSYSSKLSLKSLTTGSEGMIYFSGNPAKFLQGHNLFGSTNVVEMMQAVLQCIFEILAIKASDKNLFDIGIGN